MNGELKMKKFFNEFKEFAMRGNVVDLAVGVIIGGAFQKIITSFVNDVISPIIGVFANKDFSSLQFEFFGVAVKYGSFITEVINFIIMAFIIFVMVKALNSLSKLNRVEEEKKEEITTKKCPFCCSEIDIKATRCPKCTSILEEEPENQKTE